MTLATAYWCVLVTAFLPYVWAVLAKAGGERFDNRNPRAWLARQHNPRSIRANAAQLNAFEAFPAFAASVVLAQLGNVDHKNIAGLAIAFVIARILHGVFYITDRDKLRSLVWALGFLCVIALLVQAGLGINGG